MIKHRSEFVDVTDQINLTVTFKDQAGNPIDTDSLPKISIIQPSGMVLLAPTSVGVSKESTGKYAYLFTVPINGPYGVFQDVWVGFVNGFRIEAQFSFVVSPTQMPAINTDGYVHLGDVTPFDYSQTAIKNINKLLKSLRMRLNSSGKSLSKDKFGNEIWVSCDIFSVDVLVTALATSLSQFNQVPYFTWFQFHDTEFVEQFLEILVQGATIYCLASKALIERGREFNITDNSISFAPPSIADLMMTQYSAEIGRHNEFLKMIKASMRPAPRGLGTLTSNSAGNPHVQRLRRRRQGGIW